jgi:hypothetical protein
MFRRNFADLWRAGDRDAADEPCDAASHPVGLLSSAATENVDELSANPGGVHQAIANFAGARASGVCSELRETNSS